MDELSPTDAEFMRLALHEARLAALEGEVPVGAALVVGGHMVATAHNRKEATLDPTGHAELLAIRDGALMQGAWRLAGSTLYVTLEPCAMCAGALVQARVERLVYGCRDPKAGAVGSLMNLCQDPRLNHRLVVTEGVLADEASQV